MWAFTAAAAAIGWAILRAKFAPRWLGIVSLAAAVLFLFGSVSSVLGATPEGRSSVCGIAFAIVWTLVLAVGLWRAAGIDQT